MAQFFLPCNRCEHYWETMTHPNTGQPLQFVCIRPNAGSVIDVCTGNEEHQILPAPGWNYCISERGDTFACGPQARYYQARS